MHTGVWGYIHVGVTIHGLCVWKPEVNFGDWFQVLFTLVFETGSLTGLGLSDYTKLVSLLLPHQCWVRVCAATPGFLMCVLGVKLGSSGLQGTKSHLPSPLVFSGLRKSNPMT